jgi:hypothetical protein
MRGPSLFDNLCDIDQQDMQATLHRAQVTLNLSALSIRRKVTTCYYHNTCGKSAGPPAEKVPELERSAACFTRTAPVQARASGPLNRKGIQHAITSMPMTAAEEAANSFRHTMSAAMPRS